MRLYQKLNDALRDDPPPETRGQLWYVARATLRRWLRREYASKKVEKFIGKISNGFEYWFTFILRSDVEPTNNRAERALREHVVQRKIIGTLRNEKGTTIHERIMTVLTTWAQQALNSLEMMRQASIRSQRSILIAAWSSPVTYSTSYGSCLARASRCTFSTYGNNPQKGFSYRHIPFFKILYNSISAFV